MAARPRLLVLALDIGSSSVRTAFFTGDGARIVASSASRNYAVHYTADGGAELNAGVVLRAGVQCISKTLQWRRASSVFRDAPIIAVTGSAFWHSLLALGQRGEPISPVFTWADSRSTPDAVELRRLRSERTIHARTGCMVRAPFWPAKLRWLRRTRPALFQRATNWISPAAWMFRELFGVTVTSHSMASATGLYNLRTATWDTELCRLCHVRPAQLGEIADATEAVRPMHDELRDVPVFAAIGDGAASNLGSDAVDDGRIALTIGTSAAARKISSRSAASGRIPFGLFKYVVDADRVVIGGATSNGGNLRQWLVRELRFPRDLENKVLSRTAAAADALTVLPFWVAERAPTWPEELRGAIAGLTAATTSVDLLRAATSSTFYRLAEILTHLGVTERTAPEIVVSGGILRSPSLLKILADSIGRDIRVCVEPESSLRGAAVMALEQRGHQPTPLKRGRLVKHLPALAAKHRARRAQQLELERRLR